MDLWSIRVYVYSFVDLCIYTYTYTYRRVSEWVCWMSEWERSGGRAGLVNSKTYLFKSRRNLLKSGKDLRWPRQAEFWILSPDSSGSHPHLLPTQNKLLKGQIIPLFSGQVKQLNRNLSIFLVKLVALKIWRDNNLQKATLFIYLFICRIIVHERACYTLKSTWLWICNQCALFSPFEIRKMMPKNTVILKTSLIHSH